MKVIVAGVFDVTHFGHANLLLFCRQIAGPTGEVFVSIDSDAKVARDKGDDRPIFRYHERRDNILSLTLLGNQVVTEVFQHKDNEALLGSIEALKPDYIIVGSSYEKKPVVGEGIAPIIYYHQTGISSTQIIEACRSKNS